MRHAAVGVDAEQLEQGGGQVPGVHWPLRDPLAARRVTLRILALAFVYMVGVAMIYLFLPVPLIDLFLDDLQLSQGDRRCGLGHAVGVAD